MASSGDQEAGAPLEKRARQRQSEGAPAVVQEAVLVKSGPMPAEFSTLVKGYEFERDTAVDYHALLQSFRTSGFQATNFGLAVEQINKMVGINWNRLVDRSMHSVCTCVHFGYSLVPRPIPSFLVLLAKIEKLGMEATLFGIPAYGAVLLI